MPTKKWAAGQEVVAADLNQFLQDQVVTTFTAVADRATALPTPKAGQLTYIITTQVLDVWNGTAWTQIWPIVGAVSGPAGPAGRALQQFEGATDPGGLANPGDTWIPDPLAVPVTRKVMRLDRSWADLA